MQLHREVERGLAAEGRQQGGGAFKGDDFLHELNRQRLDIGGVGELRIGHDRGRVRVHENDAVTFLAEGLASLGAGVIKLAGLTDHNGTGADNKDGLEVGALGHGRVGRAELGSTPPSGKRKGRRISTDFENRAAGSTKPLR